MSAPKNDEREESNFEVQDDLHLQKYGGKNIRKVKDLEEVKGQEEFHTHQHNSLTEFNTAAANAITRNFYCRCKFMLWTL